MSAICGLLRLGDEPSPSTAFTRMWRSLDRLGPDGRDSWQDDRVLLGHQRMAVEPAALRDPQPLCHTESRVAVTADARIDNRDELCASLGLSPHEQLSDTGLLLKAYLHWGPQCFDRMVGEFAAALWDARSKRLYCATDPMGIRPLFYLDVAGSYFAFASEAAALLNLSDTSIPVDHRRLAMLGISAYSVLLEPDRTCFEGVHRVPAGTVMTVGGGATRAREYWAPDPRRRIRFRSDAECREAFREVFDAAVRARLRGAQPVASLLSGGLDSSAIVATAAEFLADGGHRLHTLSSVPLPEAESEVAHERQFIDLFQGKSHLEMHYISAPDKGPFDQLEQLMETASLCSYSYQHYLYTALVEAARDAGARTILDGDGGELSASSTPQGYLAELLTTGRWNLLAHELRALTGNGWPRVRRHILRPLAPYSLVKALKRTAGPGSQLAYPLQPDFVADTLGSDAEAVRAAIPKLFEMGPNHRRNQANVIQLERKDLRQRSHAGFIGYHEVQFSYPYLDRRVLEFSLGVDGRFKYRNGQGRELLRLGMEGRVPEPILLRRDKAPFAPDYHQRFLRARGRALRLLESFSEDRELSAVVDFTRVFEALDQTPVYRTDHPLRFDVATQFLVPNALYICYFLKRYGL